MKKLTLLIATAYALNATAQNIGMNTAAPDASALLDITANNRGLLIPRIALTASNVAAPVVSPAISLLIFNTATAGIAPNDVKPGYYYWNSTKWVGIGTGSAWDLLGNAGTSAGTNFVGTTDAQDVVFKTNGIENMRILNSNGNIGIGTIAPIRTLHLHSPTNNHHAIAITAENLTNHWDLVKRGQTYGGGANDNFVLAYNNVERLNVTPSGAVGMGTATPATKLDIIGDIKITDGTEGQGKILTSDATGKASWKNAQNTALVWNGGRIITIPNTGYYLVTMYADDSALPSAYTNSYIDASIVNGTYNGVALYDVSTGQFYISNSNNQYAYGVSCSGVVLMTAGSQVTLGAQNWMSSTPANWCLTIIPM
jgi:hypothetical protein